jgi:Tol biopolymer transport system component
LNPALDIGQYGFAKGFIYAIAQTPDGYLVSGRQAVTAQDPFGSNICAMSTENDFEGPDKSAARPPGAHTLFSRRLRRTQVVLIVTVVAIGTIALFYVFRHSGSSPPNAVQLTLGLPHGITLHRNWHPFEYMALSPNGEMLAFAATDASGESSLWIRLLSSSEARKLEQTEGALLPFWSPDSQFIGFWAGGKLKKIRRSGGTPETIVEVPDIAQGAWGADGTILFARTVNSPIFRVSRDGASTTPATALLPGQVSQFWVQFSPDGKQFIYLARTSLTADDPNAKVYAQRLDGGAPFELVTTQHRPVVAAEHLLFIQQQNLFAQRMEWKSLRTTGDPLLVIRNVAASAAYLGSSEFAASQNGVLIYGTAERSSTYTLRWYSRDGSTIGSVEPTVDYEQFTLSPDGKHLALNSFRQYATGSLWLIDIATNTTTPLVVDPHAQSDPVWSPDSRYLAFNLLPNGGSDPPFIVAKVEAGKQQLEAVYGDNERHWVEDWSPDGTFLLTHDTRTLSILPLKDDRRPRAVYTSSFRKDAFHLSPDGHLIAYGELRDGKWEVFVASFPEFHDITQVSQAGGVQPRWRGDGRELFFLDSEGAMMSVTVDRGSPPKISVQHKLFDTGMVPDATVNQYAVTQDGQKFLVLQPRQGYLESYSVVLNWPAILK